VLMDENECKMTVESTKMRQPLKRPEFETFARKSETPDAYRSSRWTTGSSPSPWAQHDLPGMSMSLATTPELVFSDESDNDTRASPMTRLFKAPQVRNPCVHVHADAQSKSSLAPDLLSKGVVSLQDAEEMLTRFSALLDQHLWCRAALVHDNLDSVRKSSPMLLATIITVAALHTPGKEELFDEVYTEFLTLICDFTFDQINDLDDIRAYCIGALWLPPVSCKNHPQLALDMMSIMLTVC
jgi:hypothetical protein